MKKLRITALILAFCLALTCTAWADQETDQEVALDSNTETHIVDSPTAGGEFVPENVSASAASEQAAAQVVIDPSSGSGPGTIRIPLDFTLVKPVLTDTGQKFPYFKLLEVRTDENGVAWNVCASSGSKVESVFRVSDCTTQNYFDVKTTDPKRIAAIKFGLKLLGGAYQYGGNGPAYDCSGFVHACLTEGAGVASPRSSGDFCSRSNVSAENVQPGDVIGHYGHVGLYLGDGIFIHACDSRTGIITQTVASYTSGSILSHCTDIISQ